MSGIYTIPTQNALQSTLDAELAAGGTSMTLADDWSSYFTGVSADNPAILVIDRQDANGTDIPSKREYVKVTNVSGATFTIGARGMNGSTDQVHSVGARVECVTDVETWKSMKDTFEVEHVSTDGTHSVSAMITGGSVLDEDDMASDSDTALPTQQSVKAYVDTKKTLTSSDDHIVLTPGTSKLVKVAVLRQDNTTNAYKNNSVILTGWGYMAGNAGAALSETVTFGITFSEDPIVLCTGKFLELIATGVPTEISDLTGNSADAFWGPATITTGSFLAHGYKSTNFNALYNYGYTWIAIGQLN